MGRLEGLLRSYLNIANVNRWDYLCVAVTGLSFRYTRSPVVERISSCPLRSDVSWP